MEAIITELLETPRLRLERLVGEHESELAVMVHDPRVYRTLCSWPRPPTAADARAGLDREIDHWERHGFGLWLLRDRDTRELVGRGGLQYTGAAGEPAVEVAWAIVPERWGQGLATELARAALEVAFDRLGLEQVIPVTLPDNLASRRVMEKTGFVYERDFRHAGLPHVLYRRGHC